MSNMNDISKLNLSEQTKFRLSEIIGMEIIFIKRLIKGNYAVKNYVNILPLLITKTMF